MKIDLHLEPDDFLVVHQKNSPEVAGKLVVDDVAAKAMVIEGKNGNIETIEYSEISFIEPLDIPRSYNRLYIPGAHGSADGYSNDNGIPASQVKCSPVSKLSSGEYHSQSGFCCCGCKNGGMRWY